MRLARPPFIELRQYVIAAGKRDRMIELFDTHFATAQDALGLPILGVFTAQGDPDRLVWLRGFPDMESRPERLGAFYGGPVWSAWGAEAIGMVKGYDNVQMLREAAPGSGIKADLDTRAPAEARTIFATTYRLAAEAADALVKACRDALHAQAGLQVLGLYRSEPAANNFPALPIREGEHLLTWFATGAAGIDESGLRAAFIAEPERLALTATDGSALR